VLRGGRSAEQQDGGGDQDTHRSSRKSGDAGLRALRRSCLGYECREHWRISRRR